MSSTPSALRLSISASAARIGPPMVLTRECLGRVPAGAGIDRPLDRPPLVALDHVDHRLDQLLAQQGRLEAEVEQLGVDRVVVVLFLLHPWVLVVLDLD